MNERKPRKEIRKKRNNKIKREIQFAALQWGEEALRGEARRVDQLQLPLSPTTCTLSFSLFLSPSLSVPPAPLSLIQLKLLGDQLRYVQLL